MLSEVGKVVQMWSGGRKEESAVLEWGSKWQRELMVLFIILLSSTQMTPWWKWVHLAPRLGVEETFCSKGTPEKWWNPGLGQWKCKLDLEQIVVAESKEVLKKDGDMLEDAGARLTASV